MVLFYQVPRMKDFLFILCVFVYVMGGASEVLLQQVNEQAR